MDFLSLLIVTFAVVFGFFTLFTWWGQNKDMLKKLTVMQERYSDKSGSLIHTIVNSIMPIAFGLLIILVSLSRSP